MHLAALALATLAADAAPSARLDHHGVLFYSHEYLRHAQYLRGKEGDAIVTWGWRMLELPVGSATPREVVPEDKAMRFANGSCVMDVDGDGADEVIVGRYRRKGATTQDIVWYERAPRGPWLERRIGTVPGKDMPHDMAAITVPLAGGQSLRGVVVAIDRRELYLFEPGADPRKPWRRHDLGRFPAEHDQSGMAIGDVNGDGRPDVVSGMFWIETPADPRAGAWTFHRFGQWDALHQWGSMNKHAVADFDGDGRTDIVVDEAENPGSRLAVFRQTAAGWSSQTIDTGLYCPHSMASADLDGDGRVDLIVGEMDAGGWHVPLTAKPRIYGYLNRGQLRFERVVLAEGWGVHEAKLAPRRPGGPLLYYGNSTTQEWLDGMMSHLSVWTVVAKPVGLVFGDELQGGLAPGWSWLREDTNAWIARDDGLHVRALAGTLWGATNTARNLVLRDAPTGDDFATEVTVTNDPRVDSEQAGLIWYAGDGDYLKLVKERAKGVVKVVFVREERDVPRVIRELPFSGATAVLRLTRAGGQIRAEYRAPEEGTWRLLGEAAPLPGPAPRVGLLSHVSPADADRWARFTGWRTLDLPRARLGLR